MDVYMYRAALLCDRCAESSEFRCGLIADGKTAEMDSDEWPHGPYSNGGGEADRPQHCDACGVFLQNPLTDDGDEWLRAEAAEFDGPDSSWAEIAARADDAGQQALAEWIRYYYAPGL